MSQNYKLCKLFVQFCLTCNLFKQVLKNHSIESIIQKIICTWDMRANLVIVKPLNILFQKNQNVCERISLKTSVQDNAMYKAIFCPDKTKRLYELRHKI